jgi:tRNA nucleotidyltransferase (CCA-adding enzyme)
MSPTIHIAIPPAIHRIFEDVQAIVSPLYLVGGSVRDILLGHEPHDYDFATPLPPDAIEAAVRTAGRKPYLAGKSFGTIGFTLDKHHIEITTFRAETYPAGSRKPIVEFIDTITHDLSRRDFTINAIALHSDGSLVDPFHGHADLRAGIIRTVGHAYDRYNEDPLRMLRAARFAAQFGFRIDEAAEHHAAKKAIKLLNISHERWVQELDKLLVSRHPAIGLNFLARTRLLHAMLPELAIQVGYDQDSPYHQLDLWQHTLKTVELSPPDATIRWAALFHDIGKPYVRQINTHGYSNYPHHELIGAELVEKIGRYLRWSNARTHAVRDIVRFHLEPNSPIETADSDARFI